MSSSQLDESLLDDSRSGPPRRKKKKHRRSGTRSSGRHEYPPQLDHSIVSPSSLSESFIAVPLSASPSASSLSSSTSFAPSTLSIPSSPSRRLSSTSTADTAKPTAPSSILFIYLVSLLAMLIAGTAYNFSSWSPDLKRRLNYTQSELELIGYMGNFPGFVQPFVGVLCNRYRPAVTAIAAAVLMAAGYVGMGLGVSGWSGTSWLSNATVMALCNGCVVLGVTAIYTITLAVNVVNLPSHRLGAGIAVLVMGYGLSACLFSLLYVYVMHSSLIAYFLICAVICSAVCLLNAATLKKYPNGDQHACTNTTSVSDHITSAEDLSRPASPNGAHAAIEDAGAARTAVLANGSLMSVFHVLFLMLRSPLFYAYFFVMFFVGGAGYSTINNLGSIIASLNGGVPDDRWTFVCIVVLSMCNGLGRLIVSVSDSLPVRRGWFAVGSGALMTAIYGYNLFALHSARSCLLSAIGAGLAYGSMWAVIPVLTAETWPRALFAITWGWVASSPSIASLVFNAIVGALYDRQADVNHVCVGIGCWHDAFVLGVAISVVGLCIAIAMTQYTLVGNQAKLQTKKKRKARSGSVQEVEEGGGVQR